MTNSNPRAPFAGRTTRWVTEAEVPDTARAITVVTVRMGETGETVEVTPHYVPEGLLWEFGPQESRMYLLDTASSELAESRIDPALLEAPGSRDYWAASAADAWARYASETRAAFEEWLDARPATTGRARTRTRRTR